MTNNSSHIFNSKYSFWPTTVETNKRETRFHGSCWMALNNGYVVVGLLIAKWFRGQFTENERIFTFFAAQHVHEQLPALAGGRTFSRME